MLSEKDRQLRLKLTTTFHLLNEKQRRILAAAESKAYGRSGISKDDFSDPEVPRVIPYGVYDLSLNAWVNVGVSANTAEFSVSSIKK